jgi:hypothetical protein
MSAAMEWVLRAWTVIAFVVAVTVLLHEIRLLALTDVAEERARLREEEQALEDAWLALHKQYPRVAAAQDWPELERGVRISHDGRHTLRQTESAS